MPFTVEVSLTGLAIVQVNAKTKHSASPTGVEFLPIRKKSEEAEHDNHGEAMPMPTHVPRLTFAFGDVVEPERAEYPAVVDSRGRLYGTKDISGSTISLYAEGGVNEFAASWAKHPETVPYAVASTDLEALNWIPDAYDHLGLPKVVSSSSWNAPSVYLARVVLPPGRISSRNLLLRETGEPEMWRFNADGAPLALAEHVIWRREGVTALKVKKDADVFLEFDAKMSEIRQEERIVRIAITCMPETAYTGRYYAPAHFPNFDTTNDPPQPPKVVRKYGEDPDAITSHAACPPAINQIVEP